MEIRVYTWQSCPEIYKKLGPYTKTFFSSGNHVTLVVTMAENNDTRNLTPLELNDIISSFKNSPTDQILARVSGRRTRIMFWTSET